MTSSSPSFDRELTERDVLDLTGPDAVAGFFAHLGYRTGARIEQTVDPNDKLPFTGLDVLAVVAVGGALLAVGFGVRKLASSNVS